MKECKVASTPTFSVSLLLKIPASYKQLYLLQSQNILSLTRHNSGDGEFLNPSSVIP